MTVDFETRARQAGIGVRTAVAEADLHLATPPTTPPRRQPSHRPMPGLAWALSGAAVAVAVLVTVGGIFEPNVVASDSTSQTTVASTVAPTTTPPDTRPSPAPVTPPSPSTTLADATTTTLDTVAPAIEILSPIEGEVFEEKTITFSGITEPGADVSAGPYRADVAADGSWSITLILSEGPNRAVFTATDAAGNQATAVVTPIYQPPAPPTTQTTQTTKPEIAGFTANATWIECSSEPAFDEYHGTGQPGSWVEVVSDFGSGETLVGADGKWYVKVIFDVPRGKRIEVKVKDQYGRFEYFPFVAVEG